MKGEALETRVGDVKQIINGTQGISSAEIMKKKKLNSTQLGKIKRALGDWLFVQQDSNLHRWYSADYARENHIEASINQENNTNNNNPGTRAETESAHLMNYFHSLAFPGRA